MTAACAHCRADLGDALVCPRCGHAVVSPQSGGAEGDHPLGPDWRTDTIQRPATSIAESRRPDAPLTPGWRPVEPAPAGAFPVPARYPLYADEAADTQDRDVELATGVTATQTAQAADAEPSPGHDEELAAAGIAGGPGRHASEASGGGWLPWAIVAVALILVAVGGAWLLLAPRDDDRAADEGTPSASQPPASDETPGETPAASDTPSETSGETASQSPEESPEESPDESQGEPDDVAADATAEAPQTAPPNQDTAGNPVTYVAANMLDGDPETSWRMPGDGTGIELRFTLASPTTLTRAGLINGYAKVAVEGGRKLDWYAGNRRVLAATWVFDDGTTVDQPLSETKAMQTIDFAPVTTSTVTLRLASVSPPGTGPSARNYTAVSEVTMIGTRASG